MSLIAVISGSDRSVPGAPTIGTATNVGTGRAYNNGAATVTFTAPTYNGRSAITSYTVTSSPGGFTGTGASSPITVTGLASATAYTFTVTATNAIGTSAASSASNSITATTVPQAPTIGTATAGSGNATVTYTAGATGGSAITTFTATSSPGSLTGTGASPITVSGLSNGTAYTFTVTATNANGTSAASAASNSVTPAQPGVFDQLGTTTLSGANTYSFTGIPSSYKHLQVRGAFKTTSAGQNVRYQYWNGTASAQIDYMSLYGAAGTVGQGNGANAGFVDTVTGSGPGTSNAFNAVFMLDILNYASTSIFKTASEKGGTATNGGEGNTSGQSLSQYRYTSNAVNRFTFYTPNTFTSVTQISLYGIG